MNTMAVLLLAGTAACTGFDGFDKPSTHKFWLKSHVERHGPPPASGPISAPGMMGGGPGGGPMGGRQFANTKSQIYFVDPPGMKIGWQASAGGQPVYLPAQLTAPARYNFQQGYIYRLKLSDIASRPGLVLYPSIEVAPGTAATDAFLTHNPIPCQFTEEDFDQVTAGNFVTKVIYLPDPKYQELAISGVETLVSTRLEPGVDPVLEADRRGTILMIIRVGAIDLEMPGNGAVIAPSSVAAPPYVTQPATTMAPGSLPGTVLPPNSLPPGASPVVQPVVPPTPPGMPENAPLDTAPVSPARDTAPPPPGPGAPLPPPPPPAPNPEPPANR